MLGIADAQAQRAVSRAERNRAAGVFEDGKAENKHITRHDRRTLHLDRSTCPLGRLAQEPIVVCARGSERKRPRVGAVVRPESDDHVRYAAVGVRANDERAV